MIVLLSDANINGHVARLEARMRAEPWIGFWNGLHVSCVSFAQVDLDPEDSDLVVWQRCQDKRLLLITGNRNDDGPDSLENTIRTRTTPQSLPVFTIGDVDRILTDGEYAAEVVWSLFEYLFDLDGLLWTGRLYLP